MNEGTRRRHRQTNTQTNLFLRSFLRCFYFSDIVLFTERKFVWEVSVKGLRKFAMRSENCETVLGLGKLIWLCQYWCLAAPWGPCDAWQHPGDQLTNLRGRKHRLFNWRTIYHFILNRVFPSLNRNANYRSLFRANCSLHKKCRYSNPGNGHLFSLKALWRTSSLIFKLWGLRMIGWYIIVRFL